MPLPLVVPLAIGAGMAVAGGVGAAASGALGSSKRVKKYEVGRQNYLLGGSEDYARNRAGDFQAMGRNAMGRNLLTGTSDADYRAGIADYRQGMGDYRQGMGDYRAALGQRNESRGRMVEQLGMLSQAAQGNVDSVAARQMKAGTEDAAMNALQIAASSRGGGAGATMTALDSNVMASQRANRDAGMLRAQETAQARSELASMLNAIQQSDLAAMESGQGAARIGQGAAQLGQGLSQLGMQQQGIGLQQQNLSLEQQRMNDAQYNAMAQAELGYQQAALQGTMGYADADLKAGLQQQQINVQLEEAARQRRAAFWGGLMNAGAGVAGMGMSGAMKP